MSGTKNKDNDITAFTSEFLARYEPLECLSRNEISETYLVKLRETDKKYVVKIYDKYFITDSFDERMILEKLDHPAVPKLTDSFETEESVYVVREYVQGKPLDEMEEPLSELAVLNIGTQLCDILAYLHTQLPPVIHRDIKPSNVIIDGDGKVCLIDFGIARLYKETAVKDTKYAATDGFSSPEQYGYMQTDALSDIFSLGKLLCWILTGSDDIIEIDGIKNHRLKKVVKKCAAFAPENRYKTAATVKAALLHACNSSKCLKTTTVSAAVLILMVGCFFLGRLTAPSVMQHAEPPAVDSSNQKDAPPAVNNGQQSLQLPPTSDIHIFKEPLIEQAVRLVLDINEDDPVTYSDLFEITDININGAQPLMPGEFIQDPPDGNIQSLEDLASMISLRTLFLTNQPLSDISQLAGSSMLTELQIMNCPISDLSALLSVPNLQFLHIHNTNVSDYTVLEDLKLLQMLMIGINNNISKISDLGNISHIKLINLYNMPLVSLEGVENLSLLESLSIFETQVNDFSPLNDEATLPNLKELIICPHMEPFLHTLTRKDVEVMVREWCVCDKDTHT
ncbi:MAG: serine/threonine protein kinase [Oscillospiraceae bacterium]|jgi:serine/threonine protein kinase|nr:serine/threonine protein kinase [Oscillospiraceae bacterium]